MTRDDASRIKSDVERIASEARRHADQLMALAVEAASQADTAEAKAARVVTIATKEPETPIDPKLDAAVVKEG